MLTISSVTSDSFVTPWTAARQASLSPTSRAYSNSSIKSVMPFNHLILCPHLILPSIFPSIRWPKYWDFTISPSNKYSGLICFLISLQSKGLLSLFRHLSLAQFKHYNFQQPPLLGLFRKLSQLEKGLTPGNVPPQSKENVLVFRL